MSARPVMARATLAAMVVLFGCGEGGGDPGLTGPENTTPTVKTMAVSNILYSAAKVRVQIVATGGDAVTDKGICWSGHSDPAMADHCLADAGAAYDFTILIHDLDADTDYHVRGYATNGQGTAWGEDLPFRTLDEGTLPASVDPLMTSRWDVFHWPYNAFYPPYEGNGAPNGRFGAACGPTAFARVLGYWGGRITATGQIDAPNTWGDVQMQVDFDTLVVDYSNLPVSLGSGATFEQYEDVARVFLIAGAIGLTNEMDVGTPGEVFIDGLKRHLNVSDNVRFARRWEYSRAEWIALLKNELAHGRPLMTAARSADSPAPDEPGNVAGHWYNIEGYDAQDRFYIDYNLGGFRGYFDVDEFGDYRAYGLVVVGFEPAS